MNNESTPLDARTVFAASALHKLLAGMEDPEEHFSQIENSHTDLCALCWRIADRMVEVRRQENDQTENVPSTNKSGD